MRIIIGLAAALLSACASLSLDDRGEFQALSSEAIEGVDPDDIRISNLHGFMLNTYWTAVTSKGTHSCSRDLTGTPECRRL